MLDEDEYARVAERYRDAFRPGQQLREERPLPLDAALDIEARFEPVRREYEAVTGWQTATRMPLMHHRTAMYGPPCHACGKPLRTPRAKRCAACWTRVPSG